MERIPAPPIEKVTLSSSLSSYTENHALQGEITPVALYEGKRIELRPENPSQVLITENLNGCTATVVVTNRADHTRSVQLVHFPPFFLDSHLAKINTLATPEDALAETKEALIYMSEKRQENLAAIMQQLKSVFGENIAITHKTYTENTKNPEAGILAVEVPANTERPVIYHTDT